jgi:RNA recognition motif-containing protein
MVRTKVFVGNLSFQTQEAELAAEFGTAGKVISANIITRGPRSLGYGFVEMDSEEDAHNAVKLMSKKEINGREINVEIAKPQDESKVRQPRPKEEEGEDARRRRPRRRPKKDAEGGAAPSQGQKKEVREEGEGNEEDKSRRPRNRKRRGTPGQPRVEPEENREESKTTLFVANLPFSLDDDGFAKVVSDLGLKLKVAHVVKKRNGRSKGYGFVEFDNQEDQQKALAALNKKIIDSRELSVKIALTEIRRDEIQGGEERKEAKPAEKRTAPAEKRAAPAEKKASPAPAEKKAVPAEKKVVPAEKKASPAPAEKKAAPASPVPAEKKTAPAEKKTAPAEKKAAPAEKKTATPEKKDEKK